MHRRPLSSPPTGPVGAISLVVAVAAIILTAAACGGSEESSSSTTTSAPATTAAPSTTAGSGSSGGTVDCAEVQGALSRISELEGQATSEGSQFSVEQFNQDIPQLQQSAQVIEQQAQVAGVPAQTLELYTQRITAVIGLLEQLAQTQNQQEFQTQYQALQTPEYNSATQAVASALKAQCPSLTD